MARDEALLECSRVTTVRTYGWTVPTVSLGYFQDHDAVVAALAAPRPVVRRITGGGAIHHSDEVTWSLVGVLGQDGLPARTRDLAATVHGALALALAAAGAELTRQKQTFGDRRYRLEPRCFASPAADDLVCAGGGKVLGSAARARGNRVLLHGSLKLASNEWDGDAVSGCGLGEGPARAAVLSGLAQLLGPLVPADWTGEEEEAVTRIRHQRYGDDAWVHHRQGPRP